MSRSESLGRWQYDGNECGPGRFHGFYLGWSERNGGFFCYTYRLFFDHREQIISKIINIIHKIIQKYHNFIFSYKESLYTFHNLEIKRLKFIPFSFIEFILEFNPVQSKSMQKALHTIHTN